MAPAARSVDEQQEEQAQDAAGDHQQLEPPLDDAPEADVDREGQQQVPWQAHIREEWPGMIAEADQADHDDIDPVARAHAAPGQGQQE